ncbi:MAG TPA: DUF983 domain-containing protein [Actinomycetota bacterium]|nr:DUF983 domain-containing protein [Actinomycetota bacterium]
MQPNVRTLVWRGLTKKCPVCGRGKVFESWFHMRKRCTACGYTFEREEGYWVGALIVNIAFAEIWFAVLFVGVLLATLPDVAWVPLLVVALITNGLLPVFFYPYSRSLWMALDLHFHPALAPGSR